MKQLNFGRRNHDAREECCENHGFRRCYLLPSRYFLMNCAAIESTPVSGRPASGKVDVVHLVLTLDIGGLEKVVYDLVRCTDRDRFRVRVLCLGEIGGLGPAFEEVGIPVESLDVHHRGPFRSVLAVARRLRELRPDVLHTHNAAPHLVGGIAARIGGTAVVVHTRHGQHRVTGWSSKFINKVASRLTHQVVAVSADAAEVARSSDGIPETKLCVIPNGIDLERFTRRDAPSRNGRFRLIHVARLNDPVKDQSMLLRAARLVADVSPGFELDIVGDGPSRAHLEALCDELNLRPHVKFLGFRHDIDALLQQADLFVLSSVTEGLSISLLEAMAAGLPIVATDVGGNSELVTRGVTGVLVPPRDPRLFADAILEMLNDPTRAAQMGTAGRRRVEDHFDLRQVAAKYAQIYEDLLHS